MAEGKRDTINLLPRAYIPRWQQISSESEVKRIIAHQDEPRPKSQQQQPQHGKKKDDAASQTTVVGALPDVVLAIVFNGDLLTSQSLAPLESTISEAAAAMQGPPAPSDGSQPPQQQQQEPIDLNLIKPAFVEWKITKASPFGNHLSKALLDFSVASTNNSNHVVVAAILRGELLDKMTVELISDNEAILSSDRARRNLRSEKEQAAIEEQDALTRNFVMKFLRHSFGKVRGAPTGRVTNREGSALAVDINKMLHMGKELLGKRSPQYAEKFFSRAVDTLEALVVESVTNLRAKSKKGDDDDDDEGQKQKIGVADLEPELVASLAESLAWRVLARFVCNSAATPMREGVIADGGRIHALLSVNTEASALAREYTGIVLRAEALVRMTQALPESVSWTEAGCGHDRLRKKLEQNPKDNDTRSLLIMTLFLAGDMERCFTEAIKLATMSVAFGAVAVSACTHFLGPENELVKKL